MLKAEKIHVSDLKIGDVISSKKFECAKHDKGDDAYTIIDDRDCEDIYTVKGKPTGIKKKSKKRKNALFVVEEIAKIPYEPDNMGGYGWEKHKEFYARMLTDRGAYNPEGQLIRFSEPYGATTDVNKVWLVGQMKRSFVK